ncbi:ADP-ribosylation factor family-domain-containing protein [Mycena capillaripes]|nr:ADP-ribosylation factor family-domain-containing protein [Mycena capillaripes]
MGSTISTAAAAGADLLAGSSMLPKTFEILMVGLDDAGCTMETVSYRRHSIKISEFGGMDKIRPLWRRYFWHAHGFVFALDAAAPTRFAEAKEELQQLWDWTEDVYPVLVLANKVDLPDSAAELSTLEEVLGVSVLTRHRSGRRIVVKGISAMTGEGMNEALEWFVENISHKHIAETNEGKKHVIEAD